MSGSKTLSGWKTLGRIAPEELTEARLQLHHAVQLVAIGVGRSLIPERPDDSHTNLVWDPDEASWLGEEIPGSEGVKAGLKPADLTFFLTRRGGEGHDELELAGHTLEQAVAWLRQALDRFGVDPGRVSMHAHYQIPDHPTASEGRPFDGGLRSHFEELARWYADAHLLLAELRREHPTAEIRTWPHHFDIATLLRQEVEGAPGGEARTVGVGMTPGDEHYPVPYFYVTPWPYPEAPDLPELPAGGEWHTDSWIGAILQAPRLTELDGAEQRRRAEEFLGAAVGAAEELVASG